MTRFAGLFALIATVGCTDPDPKTQKPNPPDQNDPAFSIRGLQPWYTKGDSIHPGYEQMTIVVTAPDGTDFVDAYIADHPVIRMWQQDDGFSLDTSVADVPVGAQQILFTANGADTAFASAPFNRSEPYYVLVTTDYDFPDPTDGAIGDMDAMHAQHPAMMITHFWAPYTYTDPGVTAERRDQLTTWIQTQRDAHGDEIGLHIHPYCSFVEDTGLPCITDRSTVYPTGDMSGYTIELDAYGHDNFGMLLDHAAEIFTARGLGKPQTFRAGGWTADLNTLKALDDKGFVADTSALNWARIEEWNGYALYDWNMQHWAPINDTSQPYYPSNSDVLTSTPGSNLALLEVPDNGVMIDYVSTDEMTMIFNENWNGQPLAAPRTLMMGFHPAAGFNGSENIRVNQLMTLADNNLAKNGLGPVVYTTLSDLSKVFPVQ